MRRRRASPSAYSQLGEQPLEPEVAQQREARELQPVGMLGAGEAVHGVPDPGLLLESSEHHRPAAPADRRDEEPVATPGVAERDRARGVATEGVGHEPLVAEHRVDVGDVPGHPPQSRELGTGGAVHVRRTSLESQSRLRPRRRDREPRPSASHPQRAQDAGAPGMGTTVRR